MKTKLPAWLMIAAQLFPNVSLAQGNLKGRALVLNVARKLARSDLFQGPAGMSRLESALQKAMDRQASRIEKALATRSDEELLKQAEATLEHAKKAGKPALEARMRSLLASPTTLRAELARELDPALRADFLNHVHTRLARAGSVEALVDELAAGGGGGGDDDDCWNYKLSYTEVATGLFTLIWDGLDGAPPKTLLWAIPLLIAIAVIAVPVAFLADTLVFFPIWFFGAHMQCEHGG